MRSSRKAERRACAAASPGVQVSRNHVLLETPIKTIGLYTVHIALHPELAIPVTLNVARSQDEADAQSRGEVLTGPVSERAEALAAAEELFESEAQAQAAVAEETEEEEK